MSLGLRPGRALPLASSLHTPLPNRSQVRLSTISCAAMKSYRLSGLSDAEVSGLKARPRIDFSSIFGMMCGCEVTLRLRTKFDKVALDDVVVRVSDLPDVEIQLCK
ncbi:hypothetical protein E2562_017444 [Oryza meyeriana var. granulata]|uniref:Uncharacterized protein n=1 Tax=Oryza meyeriana var. granulata TaxID=110450 RepID=A0A6G1DWN5_9ORYZ|nr:hypothetical protein E2562_017444 [Oryza meyeriana var. granulata]